MKKVENPIQAFILLLILIALGGIVMYNTQTIPNKPSKNNPPVTSSNYETQR